MDVVEFEFVEVGDEAETVAEGFVFSVTLVSSKSVFARVFRDPLELTVSL